MTSIEITEPRFILSTEPLNNWQLICWGGNTKRPLIKLLLGFNFLRMKENELNVALKHRSIHKKCNFLDLI
jgi:hypothetical protein